MYHRLEAEIEEAHVKAKEEMMQGIQMAKEVAQKELSEQRALYEDRIQALERELVHKNSFIFSPWHVISLAGTYLQFMIPEEYLILSILTPS